jgi:hypothetical protein
MASKKVRGRAARAAHPANAEKRLVAAPSRLPADAHRHYESEFVPIRLTKALRAHEGVQVLLGAVGEGVLDFWELGRKGTHISSRFLTCEGTEDTLTSPDADDDDYESLVEAHLHRLAGLMGFAPETDEE